MANFNKVILMGNLTRDPELRYTPSGTPVCEFGLATNRSYTTRDGEQREEPCFVDITMWGRRGEVISEYLSKGSPIFVEGRLQFDTWETSDGKRSKLSVVAENFEFLGSGGRGAGPSGGGSSGGSRSGRRSGGGQRSSGQGQSQQPQQESEPSDDMDDGFDVSDDEIPF
jgi:single-strand DNA-binding protein